MSKRLVDWRVALGLLPILAVAVGIENHLLNGSPFPIPFLLAFAAVVFAGAFAGRAAGCIAGALAGGLILHAYYLGTGPAPLTGALHTALMGTVLLVATGFWLGCLRDQNLGRARKLRRHQDDLQHKLAEEAKERQRSQTDSVLSQARLRSAVRLADIGHFEFETASSRCSFCSERHAAHFGFRPEDFIRTTAAPGLLLKHVHPDDRDRVRRNILSIKKGIPQDFEYRALRPDGEIRHIREIVEPVADATGMVIREIGTSQDMTELRRAEVQLRESQKLEAVGHLTAGIAHDFNNLLAVILGNLELLEMAEGEEERRALIAAALGATTRGSALTSQLLSFGRKAMLRPEPVDVCSTLAELEQLFRRTLPANIEVEMSGPSVACVARIDRAQFESALLNLVVNAADAMPDGGKLCVTNAHVTLAANDLSRLGLDVEAGDFVATTIADTGRGMPEDVRRQAFDPFFTTKEVGKGSGLGLSMVLGFARQSGGDVRIESVDGEGTRVTLYFPAADMPADWSADPGIEAHGSAAATPGEARQTVLLAEDDPAVRRVTQAQLEKLGHRVVTAGDAQQALELLRGSSDFSLLLSDIAMPGEMQGTELVGAARALYPDLPVILMSGYHRAEREFRGADGGAEIACRVLTKPVRRAELRAAIDQVLTGPATGEAAHGRRAGRGRASVG